MDHKVERIAGQAPIPKAEDAGRKKNDPRSARGAKRRMDRWNARVSRTRA
jgi:hypothetical protein